MINNGCFLHLSDRINKLNVFSNKVVDILVEDEDYYNDICFLLVFSDGSKKQYNYNRGFGITLNPYKEIDASIEALIGAILSTLPYMDRKMREIYV